MTKRLPLTALFLAVALPMQASTFTSIARALETRTGLHRVWIPFLGVARAVVAVVRPNGVHDLELVKFEGSLRDGIDVDALFRTQLAREGFTPLVRARSRRSGEHTVVYARPRGSLLELYVFTHDASDTVLVRVEVDPEMAGRRLREPRRMAHVASR